ncbi:hypothetical protein QKT26_gp34 [Carcinus maenas nudivirus]|uniref:Uncharacterized protein n=1 Tax=Carcinus maenas nudivirus TaxID=2880837 RepID=A0AAE8Y0C9_9VIRU|nr:hypothetical protein QKT26_gp34 [Carcinus maenas nudivirus]UBZ25624.1 hypothetical protein CmNV_034 [Carcinus maenas nudivirus]
MYIYKSIYNCNSTPTLYNKDIILPQTDEQLKFAIYIIPHNESLYNIILDNNRFSQISMSQNDCYIYILSVNTLASDILEQVEQYISRNIPNVFNNSQSISTFKPITYLRSIKDALNLYQNITVFLSKHNNGTFIYDNYSNNKKNTISIHDSIISYQHLNDRNNHSTLCAKYYYDTGEVSIFNLYKVDNCSTVIILPPEFYIVKNTNNKIATMIYNDYIFWIITTNTFINDNEPVDSTINCTKFCPKSQNINNINELLKVFNKYKFTNHIIMNSAIASEDKMNSILFFVGIYDLQVNNKYTKYFDKLVA